MNATVIVPTINAHPHFLKAAMNAVNNTCDWPILTAMGGTFAENCNAAAEKATTDFLVFLNDDTEVQVGWADALATPFDDLDIGIVGARLTYPDGRLQHTGIYFTTKNGLTAHNDQTERPSRFVDAVTGACLAIRRSLFELLGGFDPNYINGYEDVDLCLRARQLGYTIWYEATCNVIHHESMSPGRFDHAPQNIARLQALWNVNANRG